MMRIGMLTSGGDCQALNAAMRGVVKCIAHSGEEVEFYGFKNGYRGLIYSDFRMLTSKDFSGILTKGGTILGSSRTPFALLFSEETVHRRLQTSFRKRDLMWYLFLRQSIMTFGALI